MDTAASSVEEAEPPETDTAAAVEIQDVLATTIYLFGRAISFEAILQQEISFCPTYISSPEGTLLVQKPLALVNELRGQR